MEFGIEALTIDDNKLAGDSSSYWSLGLDTTMDIVREKFKQDETVLALLGQLHGYDETSPRNRPLLAALVNATGTYAIFIFVVKRYPPEIFSDLIIDGIYPLNDYFQLSLDANSPISNKIAFELVTTNSKEKFTTGIENALDFDTFHQQVITAQKAYNESLNAIADGNDIESSFGWLKSYKNEDDNDFVAIDPYVADGTRPFKKSESKFQDELKKRESEYIIYKKFRIYCATWNVNGLSRDPYEFRSDLRQWLCCGSVEPPDIYAIALQELNMSTMAIAFNEIRPNLNWIYGMQMSLHPCAEYEELTSVRLVGMQLTIFIRRDLRDNVKRVSTQTVATGALNIMGNKGGVAVSMTLNEADICFVNSHLAAHLSEIERRNENFSEIMRRCIFDDFYDKKRAISQHQQIFWIGDLNYRINETPGLRLDYSNHGELMKHDQLRQEMLKHRVFHGFTEGEIKFRPTYKYDPGTDNYDSSEKMRAPAWCDRVLWKGARIEQLTYGSCMELRQSDHKPVYAVFATGIKTRDEQKYKRVHEDVLKRVDKYENDNQPQMTVERTDIDFGTIQFNEEYRQEITVANNCHLPVKFSFKAKDGDEKRICEKWLEVEPCYGSLFTGDTRRIQIKLQVNSRSVADFVRLFRGNDNLPPASGSTKSSRKVVLDILVLHVEDGRDIFITIMGSYDHSCFGFSMDTLCRTLRPAKRDLIELLISWDMNPDGVQHVPVPREFYILIEYLATFISRKSEMSSLFSVERKYSRNPNLNEIRDYLDNWMAGAGPMPGIPQTAAEALLQLIEASYEPLLYPEQEALLRSESFEQSCEILLKLSKSRRNVFIYTCLLLRHCPNLNEAATVFGNVSIKGRRHVQGFQDDRCRTLVLQFMQNDLTEFISKYIVSNGQSSQSVLAPPLALFN